jgi:23S rRNA pseudouridine2604 synthase
MTDRPTLKLKAGAAPRNPQRLRVRAGSAPRKAPAPPKAARQSAPADAPEARRRDAPPGARDGRRPDAPPAAAKRGAAPGPGRSDERQRPPQRPSQAKPPRPPRRDQTASAPSPGRRAPPPARPEPVPPRRLLPAATPAATAKLRAPRPAAPAARAQGIRLSKALTEQGIASRREADDWIAAGWVRVDGHMAVLGQRVRPEQRIDIDPAARKEQARSVTILLNKPVGYVSGQAEDGYPTAAALVTAANLWAEEKRPFHPGHARSLAPAGRLDIDSTGLLVLTQDGRIAKLLIGENSPVEKEYLVRVAHSFADGVPDSAMQLLRHGLELDGEALKPAKVSWANEDQLRVVLQQGKKRQIRRMCDAVGLQVIGLKRVRIGSVVLGKLPAGQWRYLRDDERF